MVGLLPATIWAAFQAIGGLQNNVIQWTAADLDAKRRFIWFADRFEGPNLIFVSWDGCTLTDNRLTQFAEGLQARIDRRQREGRRPLLERVRTGIEAYEELVSSPAEFSHLEALGRLQGAFIGPDARTTCAIVVLTNAGASNGHKVIDDIVDVAWTHCGLDADDVHLAGFAVQMNAIDQASAQSLYWYAAPAGMVVVIMAWICLGSGRLALFIGTLAGICQIYALSLIHLFGETMHGMLVVMPVLILVIFIAGSVHLTNYFRDSIQQVGRSAAPGRTLAIGAGPCSLAVVTSALGVSSLSLSRIGPVSTFGRLTAVAMLVALIVLLTVLPGALPLIAHEAKSRQLARDRGEARFLPYWKRLARFVDQHAIPIQCLCLAAVLACAFGLGRVKSSMNVTDFFSDDSRILRDYRWLEHHLGPLIPAEVIVAYDQNCGLTMHDRLRLVVDIEQAIRSKCANVITISAAAFLKQPVKGRGIRKTIERAVYNRHLNKRRPQLTSRKLLASGENQDLWRITVRFSALTSQRYRELLGDLTAAVDETILAQRQHGAQGVTVVHTGLLPLVADVQGELLRSLALSLLMSAVLITVALMIGLRDYRLGLLSILPNFFPIILVFGMLAWLDVPIDVGSMITASVGLGIAVDDTVHFLVWYKRARLQNKTAHDAILSSYTHCGGAMIRTTVICSVGLAVFIGSPFRPAANFGGVICGLMFAALFGDLVLLPALLAGPLGRQLFRGRLPLPESRGPP